MTERGQEAAPRLEELIDRLWHTPERAEWTPKVEVVALDELRSWMQSDEIEVLGFVENVVDCGKFRIEPVLPPQEYLAFRKNYVRRCLIENPDGDWSDSRYSISDVLIGLIVEIWQNDANQQAVADLKKWLADLYKSGDNGIRICIENGTLEHLPRTIRPKLLSDWKRDPDLRQAYELFFGKPNPQ
jgi:hypothetical protein